MLTSDSFAFFREKKTKFKSHREEFSKLSAAVVVVAMLPIIVITHVDDASSSSSWQKQWNLQAAASWCK
jgi:hypothetical protein